MTETPNIRNEELQEQNDCLPWNAVDALYGIACVAIGAALLLAITQQSGVIAISALLTWPPYQFYTS